MKNIHIPHLDIVFSRYLQRFGLFRFHNLKALQIGSYQQEVRKSKSINYFGRSLCLKADINFSITLPY